MKRLLKIALAILILALLLSWVATTYLKHSVKQQITENALNEIIDNINSSPPLPQSFKETYSKVYPGVLHDDFNSALVKSIFGEERQTCPSAQVANEYWWLIKTESLLMRKLYDLGFVWVLEDHVSQEKCFEYYLSYFDFGNNAKGVRQASLTYYNKPIDSLTIDEQLGVIILLKNPAYFNRFRFPDRNEKYVKELKSRIAREFSLQTNNRGIQ